MAFLKCWVSFFNPTYGDERSHSPLLAQNLSSAVIIADTPAWHSSTTQNTITQGGSSGTGQVSISQVSTGQISTSQISTSQISTSQIDFNQVGKNQSSILQRGSGKISSLETGLLQRSSLEIGIAKVSLEQELLRKIGLAEIGEAEINPFQFTPIQQGLTQVNSTKTGLYQAFGAEVDFAEISLSSSIPFQQFIGSHNIKSQSISTKYWSNFFEDASQFELSLEVTDLPTGQLAEAQLTRFDTDGHPVAGTILIDDDANGLGWFIDPTPWESSEFSTQNTAYNLQATEGSAAYVRYDLLTTILHELGHLAGFIQGYSGFDRHVKDSTFTYGDCRLG